MSGSSFTFSAGLGASLVVLLAPPSARAEGSLVEGAAPDGSRAWHTELRVDYVRLGPGQRPTGGLEVGGALGCRWRWRGTSLELGGELSSFGFDAGPRWAAVLGGFRAAGWQQIHGSLTGGLVLHLDAGRLPACAAWGLCAMFDGIYPAADAGLRYEPSARFSLTMLGGPIWVTTLPWSGAALRAGVAGTIAF